MQDKNIYILNPQYELRRDKTRVIITNRNNDPSINDFIGFVHPVYAIILSFFDGERKLEKVVQDTASLLNKTPTVIYKIVSPLLENNDSVFFKYGDSQFSFPKKLLVKKTENEEYYKYNTRDFFIPQEEMDLENWRLYSPLDALFMVNTLCITNCIYCYADRRRKMDCDIPFLRLKEIIWEAKNLNMRSFDITGGEIFLYKHWEALLSELLSAGFIPYISSKYPIDLKTIKKLKSLGIKKIQISIDSIIQDELKKILNVDGDYYQRLLETLKNLDENDLDIFTNSQFTTINTEHGEELINFLLKLENIKRISMGAAGFSLYNRDGDYIKYKASLESIKKIEDNLNYLKSIHEGKVNLNFSGYTTRDDLLGKSVTEKIERFNERSRCSANFYAFVILPDGQVTICEELYWHPAFLIGDLKKQSIEEVWNSKRASELYRLSQNSIQDNSACKDCSDFVSCHTKKGVCWKEVLYAYGDENWDFPDPKCPYAPAPFREYYM